MKQPVDSQWEERVQALARRFPYPATPNITQVTAQDRRVRPAQRKLQPGFVLLIAGAILLVGLLGFSPVRAALVEWLHLGAVRIRIAAPTPLPQSSPPPPSPYHTSVLQLSGETTLADAQRRFPGVLRLPQFPDDLGAPDRVFFQQRAGTMVVLVWLEPEEPDQVRLSLHYLTENAIMWKLDPGRVEEVQVHGQPALWLTGPYFAELRSGAFQPTRLVQGHVLVWEEDDISYRLETYYAQPQAIQIAESLLD